MAIEAQRGCGYRKVGGLYIVSGELSEPCHKLPVPLHVCPTCHAGIKPTRGWTWVGRELLGADCSADGGPAAYTQWCKHCQFCVVCTPSKVDVRGDTPETVEKGKPGRFGLLWIGERYYPTPEAFMDEARRMGVSRRIPAVPKDFETGKTWVLMAHRKAIEVGSEAVSAAGGDHYWTPGIVTAFCPLRIEQLVRQSEATPEKLAELEKRGITAVPVPDGDPDHDPERAVEPQTEMFEDGEGVAP